MEILHTPSPVPRPLTPDKVRHVRAHIVAVRAHIVAVHAHIRQRGVDPMRLLDPVEELVVLIL